MTLADLGPVLLVGAGKMGSAMLEGWLDRGLDPTATIVVDPAPPAETKQLIAERGLVHNPKELGPPASVIVVAVKPQLIRDVLPGIARQVAPGTVVVSIAAGTRLDTLAGLLPAGSAIIRAMPNTPAAIGRGITVCVGNEFVEEAQRTMATAMLNASGTVEWIEDEGLIDAVTAVSGSGPAYVFWLAECLAEAGRAAGLPADLAERLARATVSGAGEMIHVRDDKPGQLRENVTSPGGTTAAALSVLMAEDGLQPLMVKAVAAAKKRAAELAD